MFLAGHTVAAINYFVTKIITTYSPMIGQFFDTVVIASSGERVVSMAHQNLCAGNCFEPP